MQPSSSQPSQQLFTQTASTILCCICAVPISANAANMCLNCIRSQVDITEAIPKQMTVFFCRKCERYLQPPDRWVVAELESKELLSIILKKMKGLNKVRLIDASFVWTEPHSRRLKVKLTVQAEVMGAAILQQSFIVEAIVAAQTCDTCHKVMTPHTWRASVQVRQKVDHKRTFYYIEQLILKHGAHNQCVNIKEVPDGIDFFFAHRSHAIKLVEFLSNLTPLRSKTSEELISSDIKSGTADVKYSYAVEICPVCRDDIVCIPPRLSSSIGGMSPLLICTRVSNQVHLLCPATLQHIELGTVQYWRHEFASLIAAKAATEFMVMDIELQGPTYKKWALADVTLCRASEIGSDIFIHTRTHLGNVLTTGDMVWGYDMYRCNYNDQDVRKHKNLTIPEVVLVRKAYPPRVKKQRQWKLKTLDKDTEDVDMSAKESKRVQDSSVQDYERFLEELEEDPEMRKNVNIYKDPEVMNRIQVRQQQQLLHQQQYSMDVGSSNVTTTSPVVNNDADDADNDRPDIPLDELLDDLALGDDDDGESNVYGFNEDDEGGDSNKNNE